MASVLHLLSFPAEEQTRQIHALLVREIGPGFETEIRTIGNGGTYRNLPTAILNLRREKPEITYAWGIPALAAAVVSKHPRILFSPDRFAGPRALRWIRPLMERSGVTMICPTFTQQRLAISRGIDAGRCIVIQPGVDFGSVRYCRDLALRAELGFAENDFVLIAPGDSTLATAHEHAVWTSLILHALDPACKLLLWGRGPRAELAIATPLRLGLAELVTLAEQKLGRSIRFEELLAVADACLVTPAGVAPTLPIATVMASGVPIISTVTYMLSELLEDRHTALMVPNRSPRSLVQRVQDLRADLALRAKITETARAEAYEHFSMTRMMDEYRRVFKESRIKTNIEHPTSNIQH
jgi:glycosyltransferase involved in cell wall biosynthesis